MSEPWFATVADLRSFLVGTDEKDLVFVRVGEEGALLRVRRLARTWPNARNVVLEVEEVRRG